MVVGGVLSVACGGVLCIACGGVLSERQTKEVKLFESLTIFSKKYSMLAKCIIMMNTMMAWCSRATMDHAILLHRQSAHQFIQIVSTLVYMVQLISVVCIDFGFSCIGRPLLFSSINNAGYQ